MRVTAFQLILFFGLCLLAFNAGQAAMEPSPLEDSQLAGVYAAGFDVKVDFDVDVTAQDPNSVIITGNNLSTLQDYANRNLGSTAAFPMTSDAGAISPDGAYTPNYQNLVTNTLNISDNAMQNAKTLLNIIAMNGDVAVGMNLNIIINPTNTDLNIVQTNINWGNFGVSTVPTTPVTPMIH